MPSHPIDRRTFVAGAASLAASGMLPRMTHGVEVPPANYDEAKVPQYTLPDPLTMADGTKVADADAWRSKRRPELLSLFADHVYGRTPTAPDGLFRLPVVHERGVECLDGRARRTQVTHSIGTGDRGVHIDIVAYTPADARPDAPAPAFLGLNFYGNHTIRDDPAVRLPKSWVKNDKDFGITENRVTEASRGVRAHRWPVKRIVERGYAVVVAYYGDIDPDFDDGFKNGLHPLFDAFNGERPDHAWGSIGAWAWGMSAVRELVEGNDAFDAIDGKRIAAFGHSRLGKTALWAGAQDEKFAMTISNNSGCGGAALNRRAYGETVARITTSFPHWFCGKYASYANNEGAMPIDMHELVALCAPRPVYVASAADDRWADPKGEFLSCLHASPVYKLLGVEGMPATEMPAVGQPAHGTIGYHIRPGKHDVTEYDWRQYLDFADKHLRHA